MAITHGTTSSLLGPAQDRGGQGGQLSEELPHPPILNTSTFDPSIRMHTPFKLDCGMEKLINEVCASDIDINTPDITELCDIEEGFSPLNEENPWFVDPPSVINDYNSMKHPQGEYNLPLTSSPTSPAFYSEGFVAGSPLGMGQSQSLYVNSNLKNCKVISEELNSSKVNNNQMNTSFISEKSFGVDEYVRELESLCSESNGNCEDFNLHCNNLEFSQSPLLADRNQNHLTETNCIGKIDIFQQAALNDDSMPENNWTTTNPNKDAVISQHNNNTDNMIDNRINLPYPQQTSDIPFIENVCVSTNLMDLIQDNQIDLLETINFEALNDIHQQSALAESNILCEALYEAGIADEYDSDIQQKIDSFFNDDTQNLINSPLNVENNNSSVILGNYNSSPVSKLDPEFILQSFKSSPYGKKTNSGSPCVKHIKIIVPPTRPETEKYADSQLSTCNNTVNPTQPTSSCLNSSSSKVKINQKETTIHFKQPNLIEEIPNQEIQVASIPSTSSRRTKVHIASSNGTKVHIASFPSTSSRGTKKIHIASIPSTSSKGSKVQVASIPSTSNRGAKRRIKLPEKFKDAGNLYDNDFTYEGEDDILSQSGKKSKLSLSGLSDAEKYRRIREQNNIASKKCRERRKGLIKETSEEVKELENTNSFLRSEHERLSILVKRWKALLQSVTKVKYG